VQARAENYDLKKRLVQIKGLDVRADEPLAPRTSFRIGGCAEIFAVPTTLKAVEELAKLAFGESVPLVVLGGGTNVLVADEGVPGIVVNLRPGFAFLRERSVKGDAACWLIGTGYTTGRFVRAALSRKLAGAEVLVGIPGTIGGALIMNAGGHTGDISALVVRVQAVEAEGTRWVEKEEVQFGYRQSSFSAQSILVAAELVLRSAADPAALLRQANEELSRRRLSQPLHFANAGSIFKNPPGQFAGRLIESAGCKGWREGDAEVSPLHANFIVNTGGATAIQVIRLIARVRERVLAASGVRLELELKTLGHFDAEAL
jgi:UDP-N-acetylmuramate dehydrogenase